MIMVVEGQRVQLCRGGSQKRAGEDDNSVESSSEDNEDTDETPAQSNLLRD
jgi:hypothetical protein